MDDGCRLPQLEWIMGNLFHEFVRDYPELDTSSSSGPGFSRIDHAVLSHEESWHG